MKKDRQKRSFWSKRQDLNLRSPVPETGAIPPSLRLEISKLKVENGKLKVVFAVVSYVVNPTFLTDLCRGKIAKKTSVFKAFCVFCSPWLNRRAQVPENGARPPPPSHSRELSPTQDYGSIHSLLWVVSLRLCL